jgi:hypothetical protein
MKQQVATIKMTIPKSEINVFIEQRQSSFYILIKLLQFMYLNEHLFPSLCVIYWFLLHKRERTKINWNLEFKIIHYR